MMPEANKPILLAQCQATRGLDESRSLCEKFIKTVHGKEGAVFLAVPYTFIAPLAKQINSDDVRIGAESMLSASPGNFTASIAAKMLTDVKAPFVLLGTAKERAMFPNSSSAIPNKIASASSAGIAPFLCIGDTLQEHQDGNTRSKLQAQMKDSISGLPPEQLKGLTIVYDSPWIYQSVWEADSAELFSAYKAFKESVDEAIAEPVNLVASVPAYSRDLSKITATLQAAPYSFTGFFYGTLSS